MIFLVSGGSGQDQAEDPGSGEGHSGPEGPVQGPVCHQVSHPGGLW